MVPELKSDMSDFKSFLTQLKIRFFGFPKSDPFLMLIFLSRKCGIFFVPNFAVSKNFSCLLIMKNCSEKFFRTFEIENVQVKIFWLEMVRDRAPKFLVFLKKIQSQE